MISRLEIIIVWCLLQAVPLIILYVIYTYFSTQSFFELQGFWKGLVASGPIASYLFLTYRGFQMYEKLKSDEASSPDDFKDLLGHYKFHSTSEGQHTGEGECYIFMGESMICIKGQFQEPGKLSLTWESDVALANRSGLYYIYHIDVGKDIYRGFVDLALDRKVPHKSHPINIMSGNWTAFGIQRKRGNIRFQRIEDH